MLSKSAGETGLECTLLLLSYKIMVTEMLDVYRASKTIFKSSQDNLCVSHELIKPNGCYFSPSKVHDKLLQKHFCFDML